MSILKAMRIGENQEKSTGDLMYQKKVLFSNIIMHSSGTGSFPKTYFSTLAAEKM